MYLRNFVREGDCNRRRLAPFYDDLVPSFHQVSILLPNESRESRQKMNPSRIYFALFTICFIANYPVNSTSVSIKDNAYSNIVVAISPDVPNTWSEVILSNIQVLFF